MNTKVKSYGKMMAIIGIALMLGALSILKINTGISPLMEKILFLVAGIGGGIFGKGVGEYVKQTSMEKDPKYAKEVRIEEKDERFQQIRYKAKASAFDGMNFVFAAGIIAISLMDVHINILILMIVMYLSMTALNIYYMEKYKNEM